MSITDKGPALPTDLADRIDGMYEAIRRTKRSPVIDDDTVDLLRGQVETFTNLLVHTMRDIGYTCYLTKRNEVYVRLPSYTIDILWCSQYVVRIRRDYIADNWAAPQPYRPAGPVCI